MSTTSIGGLSNNGATPKTPGMLNSTSNSSALSPGQFGGQTQPTPPASQNVVPQGSQVGLIGNHTLKSTVDSTGNTTNYNAPKSNPSVLAQQQALNKLGAGLVEDGIAGPKTAAAIAKYNSGSSTPSTPTPAPTNNPTPTTAPLTAAGQAPLVQQAGQMTDAETKIQNGTNLQNDESNLAKQIGSDKDTIAGINSEAIPLGFQQGRAQVAQLAQTQKENALQGIIGNELTNQGQQIGLAQNQASRAAGQENTVFNATIPGQISGSARTYNPLDPAGTSGTAGIIQGANNQFTYDTAGKYQAGLQNLKAADSIQNQIISTLQSNPTLNSTPISAITNLNELLSGQTSQPGQQLLAQQIHQYITALGLDPATVTNIASQQKGTLGQLLDSLRQTAQTNNEALNPVNVNNSSNSSTSGSSTGGSSTSYANGGAF